VAGDDQTCALLDTAQVKRFTITYRTAKVDAVRANIRRR
jgi:hypothetical protein